MASSKAILELSLDDLVIGKGQVRTKDIQKGVEELAESIRVQGLLEPIVVCESTTRNGKYEILAGQRRFLACKHLGMKTIEAVVRQKRDETHAKVISLTENLLRRDVTQKEKIDACEELYRKYGTMKDVSEATGLPAIEVSRFVKFSRLAPPLKKLVEDGLDLRVALNAQDVAAPDGGKLTSTQATEAVKLAKEMATMTGAQRTKLTQERAANPELPVDDVIEAAKTGSKVTQVIVTLTAQVHTSLQNYAQSEGMPQDDAAAGLIEEGLSGKGFGK